MKKIDHKKNRLEAALGIPDDGSYVRFVEKTYDEFKSKADGRVSNVFEKIEEEYADEPRKIEMACFELGKIIERRF